MEHNARAHTEIYTRDNGQSYSRTIAVCDACGWTYPGGQSSDRMAHAHNASANALDAEAKKG